MEQVMKYAEEREKETLKLQKAALKYGAPAHVAPHCCCMIDVECRAENQQDSAWADAEGLQGDLARLERRVATHRQKVRDAPTDGKGAIDCNERLKLPCVLRQVESAEQAVRKAKADLEALPNETEAREALVCFRCCGRSPSPLLSHSSRRFQ